MGICHIFLSWTPKEITYRQLSSDKRARKLSSAKVRHLSFCEVGIIRSVYFKQLVLHSLFIWSNFLSPVSFAATIGSCLMLVSSPLMSNQPSPQLCPQSLWSLFNLSHSLRPALEQFRKSSSETKVDKVSSSDSNMWRKLDTRRLSKKCWNIIWLDLYSYKKKSKTFPSHMHVHTTDHDQDACPVRPSMDPTIVSWDLRMSPIQLYKEHPSYRIVCQTS